MMFFFDLRGRGTFLLCCLGYYLVLAGYFLLLNFFFSPSGVVQYGLVAEIGLGVLLFLLTALLAPRVDFLWFSYRIHKTVSGTAGHSDPIGRLMYYLATTLYYIILALGIVFYVFFDTSLHFLAFYYGMFLWATFVLYFKDLLIPSYSRYQRLLAEGKWGTFRRLQPL